MTRHWRTAFLLLAWAVGSAYAAAPAGGLEAGMVNPGYHEQPSWFKTSFLDIREDVADASAAGKRVLLYFYQDGCPYCSKLLQDNFADREIAEQTRQNLDVIAINMWGDREVTDLAGAAVTEKDFAAALKVQYTPTLLFLDEQGQVLVRVNGYFPPHKFKVVLDYVSGRHESAGSLAAFYAKAAPKAASGEFHREGATLPWPLRLGDNRAASPRHLLVIFEQHECADCDELHRDILRRREVATSLSNLDVAQVDRFSSEPLQAPDGRQLPGRDWAAELGVQYSPSLVFFDPEGREVFRTEAYLKSFHIHGAIDYVVSGAYRWQPNFQRYLQTRREALEARGFAVDLMD
jgi:thioredoxin-related protein